MCASMGNICQFKMLQNVGNKKYHTQISWLTLNILGIDAQIILAFFLRTLIDEYIFFNFNNSYHFSKTAPGYRTFSNKSQNKVLQCFRSELFVQITNNIH